MACEGISDADSALYVGKCRTLANACKARFARFSRTRHRVTAHRVLYKRNAAPAHEADAASACRLKRRGYLRFPDFFLALTTFLAGFLAFTAFFLAGIERPPYG